ncbi:Oleoyl-(Acyl-carrier-protein) hydrolase [Nocardiopsis rhodophaea]
MQYPGRQERRTEPLIDDLIELADRISEELPAWLDRPTAFLGHSMGASLAFEVARRLERNGSRIECLLLSGRQAPRPSAHGGARILGDDELVEEMRKLSGTNDAVLEDPEIVRMVLPAIRSDYRALATYRYLDGGDVSCPIVALVGDKDPKVTVEGAKAWCEFTSGLFRLEVFPGGHFFLSDHESDFLAAIADHVAA